MHETHLIRFRRSERFKRIVVWVWVVYGETSCEQLKVVTLLLIGITWLSEQVTMQQRRKDGGDIVKSMSREGCNSDSLAKAKCESLFFI